MARKKTPSPPGYPRVNWTGAMKRKLLPRRGGANNPKGLAPVPPRTRAEFRAARLSRREGRSGFVEERATADFKALYQQMLAHLRAAPDTPLVTRHEALAFAMNSSDGSSRSLCAELALAWVACEGLAFAIRALVGHRALNRNYWGDQPGPEDGIWLYDAEREVWHALRRELACCSDADWAAARDAAAQCREGATLSYRCMTAFLFPEEGAWGDAAIDEALAWKASSQHNVMPSAALPLFASGASLEQLLRLEEGAQLGAVYYGEDSYLVCLVDRIGAAAEPLLVNLHARQRDLKKPFASRLLTMVESEATARAAAERLDKWAKALTVDAKFLKGAPTLAMPALRAVVVARGEDAAPRAAALLKELEVAQGVGGDEIAVHDRASLPPALASAPWSPPLEEERLRTKAPKMPAFWTPASLPPLVVAASGKPLGLDVVEDIGGLMAGTDPYSPHPALVALREVTTPASRREFVMALFSAWTDAGHPTKHAWAIKWMGWLGGDVLLQNLADLLDPWCDHSFYRRAVEALDAFAVSGTDEAARMLDRVSRKAHRDSLRYEAALRVRRIAEARGLEYFELLERLIPDLGLGPGGTMVLDYGPRQFTVGFDAALRPCVWDMEGGPLKDLPRPGKRDDEAIASEARGRWLEMKRAAREVAREQKARLGDALVNHRRWTRDNLQRLVDHRLLGGMMRGLLWGEFDERAGLLRGFRVDEAGHPVDLEDEAFTPGDNIGLVHPAHLDAASLVAWRQHFRDYQLVQPIEQLERRVLRLDEETGGAEIYRRLQGATVDSGWLTGLRSRGWGRGAVEDAGLIHSTSKAVTPPGAEGHRFFSLEFDPGLDVGMAQHTFPEQNLKPLVPAESLADLHPVDLSELLMDLETLLR